MTIQELKAKYKDDAEAISVINDLEAKINNNKYLQDNLLLQKENAELKQQNELLYNSIMNGANKSEDANAPRFKDYTNEIMDALRNK